MRAGDRHHPLRERLVLEETRGADRAIELRSETRLETVWILRGSVSQQTLGCPSAGEQRVPDALAGQRIG
jgi:hypothetical protein